MTIDGSPVPLRCDEDLRIPRNPIPGRAVGRGVVKPVLALAVVALIATAACGDNSDPTLSGDDTSGPTEETGIVAVSLEPVDSLLTEGFELGLRYETADGEVLGTTQWTEFVAQQEGDAATDFYGSIHEQSVPAGPVTVLATMNIGIGPPPIKPDVNGELRCRLDIEVPAGGMATVEVLFDGTDACLRPLS